MMIGKQGDQSWTISDEFYDKIEVYIPKHQRDPNKEYKRRLGGGRKPPDMRAILMLIFVLFFVMIGFMTWQFKPLSRRKQKSG
jgi:hypothetical protein